MKSRDLIWLEVGANVQRMWTFIVGMLVVSNFGALACGFRIFPIRVLKGKKHVNSALRLLFAKLAD